MNNNKFRYQVQTFIDTEDDRNTLYSAVSSYEKDNDINDFVTSLKQILNRPERLRMYDLLRPWVIPSHQMDYNLLVPYVSNRQRTVQLNRRKNGSNTYGFSIRGGREHGIGVFVSEVVEGSIAYNKGLRVGDQIVRINGLSIDEAIHEEVLNLIARSKSPLVLKVKSVGMIPVRSYEDDVEFPDEKDSVLDELPNLSSPLSAPPLSPFGRYEFPAANRMQRRISVVSSISHASQVSKALSWVVPKDVNYKFAPVNLRADEMKEVKIFVDVSKTQKFGCSICKGPMEKQGIFIQTTIEGGLAHEVGLRTGDQILMANGRNFNEMSFQEAVAYLKSCKRVELLVRKGAAVGLFASTPTFIDDHHLTDGDRYSNSSNEFQNANGTTFVDGPIGIPGPGIREGIIIESTSNGPAIKDPPMDEADYLRPVIKDTMITEAVVTAAPVKERIASENNESDTPLLMSDTLLLMKINNRKSTPPAHLRIETEEQILKREMEEEEERRRNETYLSKVLAKERDEAFQDLLHSASNIPRKSSTDQLASPIELEKLEAIHKASIDEQNLRSEGGIVHKSTEDTKVLVLSTEDIKDTDFNRSSISSNESKESRSRKKPVWVKTPLTLNNTSPEPLVRPSKGADLQSRLNDGPTNGEHDKERKTSHAIQETKRLTVGLAHQQQNGIKKDKKSVSFASDEENVFDRKVSSGSLNDVKRQSVLVKPTPHMFIEPNLKKSDDEFEVILRRNTTTPPPLLPSSAHRKSITDSATTPPKPPGFYFPPKVTIGIYGSTEQPPQPQRIPYLPTKVNNIKIESKTPPPTSPTAAFNGFPLLNGRKGTEARPLIQTQLSIANGTNNKKKPEEEQPSSVSSFSAARAKFLAQEKEQQMNTRKVSTGDGRRRNVIVIVKKAN